MAKNYVTRDNTASEAIDPGINEKPPRKMKVFAGPCPKVPKHGAGRVYTTKGRIRYCVCDECGHTWTKAGEVATSE